MHGPACDKRLPRLISKIHHTSEFKQCCHVGNTAQQCRLGLFQDSDFAGDLEDSKSTSGRICIFRSYTFLSTCWMCKKQTSVSHSSTESKIISLSMQVYEWMEFPFSIFGIWLMKCCIPLPTNLRNPKNMSRETCCMTHQKKGHQEPS